MYSRWVVRFRPIETKYLFSMVLNRYIAVQSILLIRPIATCIESQWIFNLWEKICPECMKITSLLTDSIILKWKFGFLFDFKLSIIPAYMHEDGQRCQHPFTSIYYFKNPRYLKSLIFIKTFLFRKNILISKISECWCFWG